MWFLDADNCLNVFCWREAPVHVSKYSSKAVAKRWRRPPQDLGGFETSWIWLLQPCDYIIKETAAEISSDRTVHPCNSCEVTENLQKPQGILETPSWLLHQLVPTQWDTSFSLACSLAVIMLLAKRSSVIIQAVASIPQSANDRQLSLTCGKTVGYQKGLSLQRHNSFVILTGVMTITNGYSSC